jgi:hypothetical protein
LFANAVRDDAYTQSRHTAGGAIVQKDLAKGKEAHIFNEGVDLKELERKVWTSGTYGGIVRGFDRFTYTSDTPIGRRIEAGTPDIPLYTVEIKGRTNQKGEWVYHLVPRTKAAK